VEGILQKETIFHPFNLLIISILIEPDFLKNIVKIARPIAASAAATTRIKSAKICPNKSLRMYEKPIKLMLAANNINSIDIKIVIIFFLFMKIPRKPIEKIKVDKIKK
tara:strand:- start:4 stop:327 length:324 start_codon:yes stop_codon:yes gene_type:complete